MHFLPYLIASVVAQEQLHLSLTGKAGEVALDFVSVESATGITVLLDGVAVPSLECATSNLNGFQAKFCTALFTGLTPNSAHGYVVKSSEGSANYSFVSEPESPVFAIYADFGLKNDESMKTLVEDAKEGGFDYVIHAGDWAYNLDDVRPPFHPPTFPKPTRSAFPNQSAQKPKPKQDNSNTGNLFMRAIEPFAATKPYMGTVFVFVANPKLVTQKTKPYPTPVHSLTRPLHSRTLLPKSEQRQPRGVWHPRRRQFYAVRYEAGCA